MELIVNRFGKDGPTDARQIRSRKALTGALLALLVEKPFDQLTIREITNRAGTGYATFFRHYPTKEALLEDIAAEQIANLLDLTLPILKDRDSYESARTLCFHVDKHRKLWSALLTGGAAGILRDEFIRQARVLISELSFQPEWLPADLGVIFGAGSTIDLLAWWLSQDEYRPPEEIANIVSKLIVGPLLGK